MKHSLNRWIIGFSTVAALMIAPTVMAQQVRTGGSTGGTTSGLGGQTAGGASQAGIGGTTEGLGGLTTGGLATAGAAEGGFAGANAASGFVGGNTTDGGFVGGARQSTLGQTANRQFRGITDEGVFGGQAGQQTGTPRQIRVAFRVGFTSPTITQAPVGTFSPANSVSVQRFAVIRPELAGVQVNLTSAGVATLSGVTTSESASRLAANLIRLQPGVRSIDNQLVVTGVQ